MIAIFQEIEQERRNQDSAYGCGSTDDLYFPWDWTTLICHHAELATMPSPTLITQEAAWNRLRKHMVHVAAVAVAAIEAVDRKYPPEKVLVVKEGTGY